MEAAERVDKFGNEPVAAMGLDARLCHVAERGVQAERIAGRLAPGRPGHVDQHWIEEAALQMQLGQEKSPGALGRLEPGGHGHERGQGGGLDGIRLDRGEQGILVVVRIGQETGALGKVIARFNIR